MYKKITLASHQFRKRTFTRRNTSINHRNIVIEPKKVSQVVLSPHHPYGSLTPRQKSLFLRSRIIRYTCAKHELDELERFTEKKWRLRACSQGVEKSGWKGYGIIKRKKREREEGERKRKEEENWRKNWNVIPRAIIELTGLWRRAIGQILDR